MMKQRNSRSLNIPTNSKKKQQVNKNYNNYSKRCECRKKYLKEKQKDIDTIERINIHEEIMQLIKYGLSEQEILERITDKFPNSKYRIYFQNWIKDKYEKKKSIENSKEDGTYR